MILMIIMLDIADKAEEMTGLKKDSITITKSDDVLYN